MNLLGDILFCSLAGGTKREGRMDGGGRESQPKIDKGPQKAKSLAPADRQKEGTTSSPEKENKLFPST